MAGFTVSLKPTETEILYVIEQVEKWFAANPKRRLCNIDSPFSRKVFRARKSRVAKDVRQDALGDSEGEGRK